MDINVRKVNGENKVVLNRINTIDVAHSFKKVSGSASEFLNVGLSTSDEVARSSNAKVAVRSVAFEVTEDDGTVAVYSDVDAGNIADFASLSL